MSNNKLTIEELYVGCEILYKGGISSVPDRYTGVYCKFIEVEIDGLINIQHSDGRNIYCWIDKLCY